MSNKTMTLYDAVKHIMQVKNCSEREAERQLEDALSSGRMKATGINSITGKCETVPTDIFKKQSRAN